MIRLNIIKTNMKKDIVHVAAIISFTAVSLEVKFTKLLFLIEWDELMFKLAMFPL